MLWVYFGLIVGRARVLPMAINGKSANLTCFRTGQSVVPYFNQQNAWAETVTFKNGLLQCSYRLLES